ncbi:uncharacterized protein PGTG_00733 [Puccinia graminis f. sp. tritici CRL 75-36-700-3]|uniref:Fungal lipase-type domain-containing protein n=1 Tax=Puccinia graminis f. sp. tritici (strain CRL 75-36-700-3 / race SCCL) TaxID=418459 RepID=E3JRN8_PUCGT|nr:uncharacterized protein PGTG_00733 [Puccinia graminis f. sp. tritici CRL 75-36-700-3]EFP74777.2 hypothetical protein PGTG_00733 [Puccinia graminis f. sp. tritici CRL 75-36-700-3]
MGHPVPTAPNFLSHTSPEYLNMNEEELEEYYQRIFESLHPLQQRFLRSHAADVISSSSRSSRRPPSLANDPVYDLPFLSLVFSLLRLLTHALFSALCNPLAPITDFTNFFYSLACYSAIYLILYLYQAFLLFCNLCGFQKYIVSISQRFFDGYGTMTWGDHTMFENKAPVISAARSFLSSRLDDDSAETHVGPIEQEFCVEVAQSILLMSAILYERDQESVERAFEGAGDVRLNLLRSEEQMLKAAADWNCQFTSIADFQTAKGPFVGAFFDLEARPNPFMVIVFKGTSFQDISEWIVDTTFNLEACADQLGAGCAHQGFYSSLFPSASAREKPSPYLRIIETIRSVAKHVHDEAGIPMNLFVGGHSLGAAIATIFYARLLESPEDIGPHTVLRDGYCYGTPRGGDSSMASRVEYNLAKPVNFSRSLWRVSNRSASVNVGDIVAHLPPGLADQRSCRSAIRAGSSFIHMPPSEHPLTLSRAEIDRSIDSDRSDVGLD